MAWDDKIKKLPDQNQPFIDMRDTPVRSNELTELGVSEITVPQDCAYDLLFAPREPSSTVPQTVFVSVNGIVYSEIDNPANLTGYTFWVNYAAARILVPTADAGKKFTQLEYDNWGTQHRRHFYTDAYESLRNIRTVAQKLFDSLEAFPNFQIKLRVASLTELQTSFPASSYEGADAYITGEKKAYRSNGVDWLAYEDITTAEPVPQVTGVSPSDGQVSVALASNVEITFSQNMNGDDLMTQFSLIDGSATPVAGAFRFYDKNGTEVTSGSIKIRKMLFDPTTDLAIANSPYSIQLLTSENILGTQMATSFTSDFSCASDMLPDACTISVTAIDGDSADVYVDALGGDYEGSVVYDVYLRDVTAAGSFVLAGSPDGTQLTGLTLASPGFLATVACAAQTNDYEIIVKTRDNAGQTRDSNVVTFQTSGIINAVPFDPVIELVSVGDTTATVRLVTASTDTEDGTITAYRGFVDGVDQGQDFTLLQGETVQFTGLTNGIVQSLTLKGKDSGGALSAHSNAVSATPSANASPTVSNLSATATTTNENYKGSITDTEGNAITGLWIQKRPAGGADWVTGMVEYKYESVDSTEVAEATSFKSANGLDIPGTYATGDYDYRACARDVGTGQYGAWVESLHGSGGGFKIYYLRDDFNDATLDTTKFGTSINGTATIVEANGLLTGTLGTDVADAAIVYPVENIVKGQVRTFRHKIKVNQQEDASFMFPLAIQQSSTAPVNGINTDINAKLRFYFQFRGEITTFFPRIMAQDTAGINQYYSKVNGWVDTITTATDSISCSLNTNYIAEIILSETGVIARVLDENDEVLFASTEFLWTNIKNDTDKPLWVLWGVPYTNFYANWGWSSDFYEVV